MVAHYVNMSDHIKKTTICARAISPENQRLMLRLCCIKYKDGAAEIAK